MVLQIQRVQKIRDRNQREGVYKQRPRQDFDIYLHHAIEELNHDTEAIGHKDNNQGQK